MIKRRCSWARQLVIITGKGVIAFRRGAPLVDNPYKGRNNLQRQRRKAWADGWRLGQQARERSTA